MFSFSNKEWLENLAGSKMRNADRIHPEWQQRALGETVKLHWATGNKVASFEPNQAIVLENWGVFVVEPLDDQHTRVILRSRTARAWSALYQVLLIELPHFIMERKMLLGLKKRAEHAWRKQVAESHGAVETNRGHAAPSHKSKEEPYETQRHTDYTRYYRGMYRPGRSRWRYRSSNRRV